ncbi:MAG TPA: response regulator [Iamia sp.]|jgi:DNA-binding response OmpR family regulator|nr:response regulator [Iamia sp.]
MTAPAPDSAPRPRILLAEDDVRLAGAYARRLRAECLVVDVVGSVAAAREHEQRGGYACLLLDRLLPDGDVLELVHEIDGRLAHPPIILVSAVADEEDRVEGLRAGADDYVAKPVRLDELAIRVTRFVGVGGGREAGSFTRASVGAVVFDLVRFRVTVGDEPLLLPDPQLRLLRLLMVNADRVVARDELLDACAAGATAEVSLTAHIEALAQALDGALTIEGSTSRGYTVRPGAHDRRRRLIRRTPRRSS